MYKLPQLEIFDISSNQLECIPDKIRDMRALRVLSATENSIRNVSANVSLMDNVKIIKLDRNPLTLDLKRIVDKGATSPSEGKATDTTSREMDTTEQVKKFLKNIGGTTEILDGDSRYLSRAALQTWLST